MPESSLPQSLINEFEITEIDNAQPSFSDVANSIDTSEPPPKLQRLDKEK